MHPRERSWTRVDDEIVAASRSWAIEVIKHAGSGHPGATLSLMPLFYLMYSRILNHRPSEISWLERDKLVLSCGHASLAQYIQLYFSGYGISEEDIWNFRSLNSVTPGHPEYGLTPGVEASSGPLGQGFATAVGLALNDCISKEVRIYRERKSIHWFQKL